ncbi:MAG TPA: hypothetical protein PKL97_02550 [Candidatus Omnitrophota bacterium]|nr:hypothetical protein [Candidatus Omnitrophota bacterium]
MRHKKLVSFVLIFAALFITGWTRLDPMNQRLNEKANAQDYAEKAGGMALRGIAGILQSPVELAYHGYTETFENPMCGLGFYKGIFIGLFWTGDKITRGAWDVLTAPVPDYHGAPGSHHDEEL